MALSKLLYLLLLLYFSISCKVTAEIDSQETYSYDEVLHGTEDKAEAKIGFIDRMWWGRPDDWAGWKDPDRNPTILASPAPEEPTTIGINTILWDWSIQTGSVDPEEEQPEDWFQEEWIVTYLFGPILDVYDWLHLNYMSYEYMHGVEPGLEEDEEDVVDLDMMEDWAVTYIFGPIVDVIDLLDLCLKWLLRLIQQLVKPIGQWFVNVWQKVCAVFAASSSYMMSALQTGLEAVLGIGRVKTIVQVGHWLLKKIINIVPWKPLSTMAAAWYRHIGVARSVQLMLSITMMFYLQRICYFLYSLWREHTELMKLAVAATPVMLICYVVYRIYSVFRDLSGRLYRRASSTTLVAVATVVSDRRPRRSGEFQYRAPKSSPRRPKQTTSTSTWEEEREEEEEEVDPGSPTDMEPMVVYSLLPTVGLNLGRSAIVGVVDMPVQRTESSGSEQTPVMRDSSLEVLMEEIKGTDFSGTPGIEPQSYVLPPVETQL